MALLSLFALSSPITITNLNPSSPNPLFVVPSPKQYDQRRPFIVNSKSTSSGTTTDGLSSKDKEILLERYGFDSKELLTQSSPKRRRGKGVEKKGRDSRVVPQEEPRPPPRTTHKLLQVAGGCPAALRPGRWLDLYSGTGSVGIEAISRGCSEAHFVEMDPWVISEVLKPNLEWTGFLEASFIHPLRVETFLERADKFVGENGSFDYISVTPPYTAVDYGILMDQIASSALVGEDTFIVVEYPLRTDMLDSCGCLVKVSDRRFGRTHLAIYGPKWAQKKRKSD